jgi:hypothetical protein
VRPDAPSNLNVKEWVDVVTTEETLKHKSRVITFLFWAYGFLIVATMLIFFLEGFRFKGFSLDVGLLEWLGGATLGEIGGLLTITIKATFKEQFPSAAAPPR